MVQRYGRNFTFEIAQEGHLCYHVCGICHFSSQKAVIYSLFTRIKRLSIHYFLALVVHPNDIHALLHAIQIQLRLPVVRLCLGEHGAAYII